jgi:hypothetical protein
VLPRFLSAIHVGSGSFLYSSTQHINKMFDHFGGAGSYGSTGTAGLAPRGWLWGGGGVFMAMAPAAAVAVLVARFLVGCDRKY